MSDPKTTNYHYMFKLVIKATDVLKEDFGKNRIRELLAANPSLGLSIDGVVFNSGNECDDIKIVDWRCEEVKPTVAKTPNFVPMPKVHMKRCLIAYHDKVREMSLLSAATANMTWGVYKEQLSKQINDLKRQLDVLEDEMISLTTPPTTKEWSKQMLAEYADALLNNGDTAYLHNEILSYLPDDKE